MKYNEPNVDYTKKVHANAPTVKDVEEIAKKIVASSQAGGGSGFTIVELSEESGTLTEEQLEILKGDNALIIYTNSDGAQEYLYKDKISDDGYTYYVKISQDEGKMQQVAIDENTGEYFYTDVSNAIYAYFGDVATEDGGYVHFYFLSKANLNYQNISELFWKGLPNAGSIPVTVRDTNDTYYAGELRVNGRDTNIYYGTTGTQTNPDFADVFSIFKKNIFTEEVELFEL